MLKYINAHIRVSELHTQPVSVPAWEIPILAVIHGDAVTVTGEVLLDRPAPETGDEFTRLATRYGNTQLDDGRQGIPYVASVYGQFGIGTSKLAQAIAEATLADGGVTDINADDLLGPVSSVGG